MDKRFLFLIAAFCCGCSAVLAAEQPAAAHFHASIQPILKHYCSDCHEDGEAKGGIAFDAFKSDTALLSSNTLWFDVLKNVRAGLMPPQNKPRPNAAEMKQLENWIKYDDFGLDAAHPDPGRVTIRRLNRVEYRNTMRDLMGVDYDTEAEFPADDTGYGFDDIGDVLTLPPMLLEKYLNAAKTIISQTVPVTARIMPVAIIDGSHFHRVKTPQPDTNSQNPETLSYYETATVTNFYQVKQTGRYRLDVSLTAHEHFVDGEFDSNKCHLTFKVDGKDVFHREYSREEGGREFHYEFPVDWTTGGHQLSFEVRPLAPQATQARRLRLHIDSVAVRGPTDEKFWIHPANYDRFFPHEAPQANDERRAYARELIARFASRAFRRPADDATVDRLVKLAETHYRLPDKTFEEGVAHAMIAVLVSPQFLFREEAVEAHHAPGSQPLVDEYSLASRLSYFLWSSMPDDELIRLAAAGQLRQNLSAQVKRMLGDPRSTALVQNFTGQWLQARDIETVAIEAGAVFAREEKPNPEIDHLRTRFWILNSKPEAKRTPEETAELDKLRPRYLKALPPARSDLDEVRGDLRRETESYFASIVHGDGNVIELVESDYTFLNEKLAAYYGLTNLNVTGSELRRVTLPAGSQRGGVLTMGTVLAVTSNPTRTSPVKRGLFILDNVLGNPTPPPPPNIPALEESENELAGHGATLREVLAIHRDKPLCSSCHSRMDPLGLALENFNALGIWRDHERGLPIDSSGKLATGETFKDARELKHILATNHRVEFYRTLTGKLLTYALGRGLEYSDVETVDQIVDRMEKNDDRFSALLTGIIESAPFQMRRESARLAQAGSSGRELK